MDHYTNKLMSVEETLLQIEEEINSLPLNPEQKLNKICEAISTIMNFPRNRALRYCSGNNIICDLFLRFTGMKFYYTRFYNFEENKYADIYSFPTKEGISYYAYEVAEDTNENEYVFHKIGIEKVQEYLNQYESKYIYNLKLAQKIEN